VFVVVKSINCECITMEKILTGVSVSCMRLAQFKREFVIKVFFLTWTNFCSYRWQKKNIKNSESVKDVPLFCTHFRNLINSTNSGLVMTALFLTNVQFTYQRKFKLVDSIFPKFINPYVALSAVPRNGTRFRTFPASDLIWLNIYL
jgi:hypothetical protein